MYKIFGFLAAVLGVYSFLIFIRIIISWFAGFADGKPVDILSRITDPYLDWWRRNLNFRLGFLDFSAIAGITFLSFVQRILFILSTFNSITLGNILSIVLISVWSILSFFLVFCMIIVSIRFIGYFLNCNVYSGFWRVIDSISQPLLYRINRIIFGRRIVGSFLSIFISFIFLAVIWVTGSLAFRFLANLLTRLPF